MEVGDVAPGSNLLMDAGDEGVGVATTADVRMGADSRDLSEAGDAGALAGHGEEAIAGKDAEEVAEFGGAVAKGRGLGKVGQFDHGRVVSGDERAEDCGLKMRAGGQRAGEGLDGFRRVDLANHLIERTFAGEGEASWRGDGGVEEEDDCVIGFDEGRECGNALRAG